MAGYVGFSKSVNAVNAEACGRMTASALAKAIGGGATAAGVKAALKTNEWHHTSAKFNRTDFYDFEADVVNFAEEHEVDMDAARAALETRIRQASKTVKVETAQKVETIEGPFVVKAYSGTGRFVKLTPEFKSGAATRKGDWVVFEDGSKKLHSNVRIVKDGEINARKAWDGGRWI